MKFGRSCAPLTEFTSNHDFQGRLYPINWLSPNILSHVAYLSFADCSQRRRTEHYLGSILSRDVYHIRVFKNIRRCWSTEEAILTTTKRAETCSKPWKLNSPRDHAAIKCKGSPCAVLKFSNANITVFRRPQLPIKRAKG